MGTPAPQSSRHAGLQNATPPIGSESATGWNITRLFCRRKRAAQSSVVNAAGELAASTILAAHLLAAQNGADIIRVHDVAETVQALRIAAAIRNAR